MITITRRALFGLVAIYGGIAASAWGLQRQLIYVPDPTRVAPGAAGLADVEEVLIEAADGVRLVAWHG